MTESTQAVTTTSPVILVVDDDAAIRTLLDIVLRELGMKVRLAASGSEALDIFRKESIDLVLLDVQLQSPPDGPTILQEMRKIRPEVNALFMSGNSGRFTKEELLALGAKDFLAKPFQMEDVRRRIVQHV